jgi:hypothetical protein
LLRINNNKGIAIQEPFAPTIKLALSADSADSASNTLSVLLKLVSNLIKFSCYIMLRSLTYDSTRLEVMNPWPTNENDAAYP